MAMLAIRRLQNTMLSCLQESRCFDAMYRSDFHSQNKLILNKAQSSKLNITWW